jgi:endonuclease-3
MTPESPAPERAREVIRRLKRTYPGAGTALGFENKMELLVAVILSAQCTDIKVNEVTSTLFRKYRTVEDYAHADTAEFERDIHSTGFYRAKTRHIIAAANMLLTDFGGEVPSKMEELTRLPGVGRKTANIVSGHGFGVIEGIPVDTHVFRVSRRLGLVNDRIKDPDRAEPILMEIVPKKDWLRYSDMVILHGRETCGAKMAACEKCILADLCPAFGNL